MFSRSDTPCGEKPVSSQLRSPHFVGVADDSQLDHLAHAASNQLHPKQVKSRQGTAGAWKRSAHALDAAETYLHGFPEGSRDQASQAGLTPWESYSRSSSGKARCRAPRVSSSRISPVVAGPPQNTGSQFGAPSATRQTPTRPARPPATMSSKATSKSTAGCWDEIAPMTCVQLVWPGRGALSSQAGPQSRAALILERRDDSRIVQ
jgi:hypothetical protein